MTEKNMFMIVFFIVGMIIGSFLNVCIYRLPKRESLVYPSSHCPHCQKKLARLDLVPVFSYFYLKRRCRYCRTPIHWRYPLVELLTGMIFILFYFSAGLNAVLCKYLFLACVLLVISFIDLEYYLIPNKLIAVLLGGGTLFNFVLRDLTISSALAGMLVPAALLVVITVLSHGGMGGGDFKLAGSTGLFLGWPDSLVALLLGCFLAGLTGIFLLITKRKKRKDLIPFAPFFTAGVFLNILWEESFLEWYLAFWGFH